MICLIIAGEIIFALPFHLARFFRPTLLEVLNLTPTQLGTAQGIYGIVALLSYFPAGLLADRFPTHKLLAISLWTTAVGGIFLASLPGYQMLLALFAFFGITTIMLFWGALIRATREWGGTDHQGIAFGWLEGGRGLLAVSLASLGVLLFEWSFPDGYTNATSIDKQNTFCNIIYGYTAITAVTGIIVWFSLQKYTCSRNTVHNDNIPKHFYSSIKYVLSFPAVWWQAMIVLCAYVGYKGIDHISLYAVDIYHYDAIEAAKLVTLAAWIRPIAAISAGFIADLINPIKLLGISFGVLFVSCLYFTLSTPSLDETWVFTANVLVTCTAVFALRALYFAVFESYRLPLGVTGNAVGIISVIGFLPDIFVLYVAGRLIDEYPGLTGHQYFFLFLSVFAAIGLISSLLLKHHQVQLKHRS